MRLAQDTARLQPAVTTSVPSPIEAAAVVAGASNAAQIEAVVSGDLTAVSPTLRARLEEIDARLTALEP